MQSNPRRDDEPTEARQERPIATTAERLGQTPDEMIALVSDPSRAPGIMARVRQRFGLSDDYDVDGPAGLQLHVKGILTEEQGKWLDGVL